MRLPIAPMRRPDPQRGRQFDGTPNTRNSDEYAAWLGQATLLVRTLWRPRPKLSPGPVHLEVVFVVAPPKREIVKLAGLWCAKRPDLDRYVHAVQDAITQAGNVWDDDSQVSQISAGKRYANVGEPPSILVECTSLPLSSPSPELAIGGR